MNYTSSGDTELFSQRAPEEGCSFAAHLSAPREDPCSHGLEDLIGALCAAPRAWLLAKVHVDLFLRPFHKRKIICSESCHATSTFRLSLTSAFDDMILKAPPCYAVRLR
ncbi:hypothetical protein KM043_006866 [Ampulex compressa]|nr:hypothetical protein KM043_006866 [Ampulex compressa]